MALENIVEKTLAIVLAGGHGTRLMPLTKERAKPAVPFGGKYRIIDFALSNIFHSGIGKTYVLTQYKPRSLIDHLRLAWNYGDFAKQHERRFIEHFDAEMSIEDGQYKFEGTADAVRRTVEAINELDTMPKLILVLSGDHIYKMDYGTMLQQHADNNADATISTIQIPKESASQFGIVSTVNNRVSGFIEKPENPGILEGREKILANMGVYVFNAEFLLEELAKGGNDFGYDLLPRIVLEGSKVFAYDFTENNKIREKIFSIENGKRAVSVVERAPDSGYWRDVGTLRAYWEANMDLVGINPEFNLYGKLHPIITYQDDSLSPLKTVHDSPQDTRWAMGEERGRVGRMINSIGGGGTIISGAYVDRSVLGREVIVHSWAKVERSVLFDGASIGRAATIKNAIIDKNAEIGGEVVLGYDKKADLERGLAIDELPNGEYVVVVPKNARITA